MLFDAKIFLINCHKIPTIFPHIPGNSPDRHKCWENQIFLSSIFEMSAFYKSLRIGLHSLRFSLLFPLCASELHSVHQRLSVWVRFQVSLTWLVLQMPHISHICICKSEVFKTHNEIYIAFNNHLETWSSCHTEKREIQTKKDNLIDLV